MRLYECEVRPVTLMESHIVSISDNNMLLKIKREEVKKVTRALHNKELLNLYSTTHLTLLRLTN